MNPPRVLIVEDHHVLALALASAVHSRACLAECVPNLAKARASLAQTTPDAILIDLGLPDGSGLDLLNDLQGDPKLRIAIITAHGQIEHAIAAKRAGAHAFLIKPIDFKELDAFLAQLTPAAHHEKIPPPLRFIGAAPSMQRAFQPIAQACASLRPVLILGEGGSGKSQLARFIASHGDHPDGMTLLTQKDSETATPLPKGIQGTLILEEIDQFSLAYQRQLLNELPGLTCRLIATCGPAGLRQAVSDHRFHPDLYYLLQGLEIPLPPLRDRLEDLPALCALFLGDIDAQHPCELSPEALRILVKYPWPGNLKELLQVLRFACLNAKPQTRLAPEHLPRPLLETQSSSPPLTPLAREIDSWLEQQFQQFPECDYRFLHDQLETQLLELLLRRFDGKSTHLAQALQMNRVTLRKKLQKNEGESA